MPRKILGGNSRYLTSAPVGSPKNGFFMYQPVPKLGTPKLGTTSHECSCEVP